LMRRHCDVERDSRNDEQKTPALGEAEPQEKEWNYCDGRDGSHAIENGAQNFGEQTKSIRRDT
jgi:hypothetical protein